MSAPAAAAITKPRMSTLMQTFTKKLNGARFRWINEQLYTQSGATSLREFLAEPELFDAVGMCLCVCVCVCVRMWVCMCVWVCVIYE